MLGHTLVWASGGQPCSHWREPLLSLKQRRKWGRADPNHMEDKVHAQVNFRVGGERQNHIVEGPKVGREQRPAMKGVNDVPLGHIHRSVVEISLLDMLQEVVDAGAELHKRQSHCPVR